MTIDVLFIHSAGPQTGDEGSAPFVNHLRLQHQSPPILIGHSLGGSVLLKHLSEETPTISAMALFLVATPFWGSEDWNVDEFVLRKNFTSFLPESLKVFLYHSRDDDVVSIEHLSRYSDAIPHAIVNALDSGGHTFKNGLSCLVNDIQDFSKALKLNHLN